MNDLQGFPMHCIQNLAQIPAALSLSCQVFNGHLAQGTAESIFFRRPTATSGDAYNLNYSAIPSISIEST